MSWNLSKKVNQIISVHIRQNRCGSPDILFTMSFMGYMHKSEKGTNSQVFTEFDEKLIRSSTSCTQNVCLIS